MGNLGHVAHTCASAAVDTCCVIRGDTDLLPKSRCGRDGHSSSHVTPPALPPSSDPFVSFPRTKVPTEDGGWGAPALGEHWEAVGICRPPASCLMGHFGGASRGRTPPPCPQGRETEPFQSACHHTTRVAPHLPTCSSAGLRRLRSASAVLVLGAQSRIRPALPWRPSPAGKMDSQTITVRGRRQSPRPVDQETLDGKEKPESVLRSMAALARRRKFLPTQELTLGLRPLRMRTHAAPESSRSAHRCLSTEDRLVAHGAPEILQRCSEMLLRENQDFQGHVQGPGGMVCFSLSLGRKSYYCR